MTSYKRLLSLSRSTAASSQKNTEFGQWLLVTGHCLFAADRLTLIGPDHLLQFARDLGAELFRLDNDGVCSKAEDPVFDFDGCRQREAGQQAAVPFLVQHLAGMPS